MYYDQIESGTYNPHLEDCYSCHAKWTEDNQPVGFYEHYICKACAERIKNQNKARDL
jgi:hypothetical protein